MVNGMLNTDEAAEYLGMPKGSLAKWRMAGTGPVYVRMGHSVRYDRADLDAYIVAQKVQPVAS